ncbi:MAG: hypothetical protein C0501_16985 [Isosphaera sp.]|nr:hypothetical protein [Isosphaera sp.]
MTLRNRYDVGSKWLIETFATQLLRVAGVGPVASARPLPAELVQSRQLPDGLVEVRLADRPDPVLCLIEVNTYSYKAAGGELLDDLLLTYLNRRVVPEVVAITLSDKGNVRVAPGVRLDSPLGHARLEAGWRVVNLWELSAADFLPLTDPGLAPWVPLMRIDGPPEPVLQQCKDVIDTVTPAGKRGNLLGVTQILAGLRFDETMLETLFRVEGAMIESPVLEKWFRQRDVETRQAVILEVLDAKFGPVPPDVSAAVRVVKDEDRLKDINRVAVTCASLDAFRQALTPPQPPAAN